MHKTKYYDFSGRDGQRIKEDLKMFGLHHATISNLPADFFRMSKSQLEKLSEKVSDAFISEMYDIPQYQVEKRRGDFGITQLMHTLNRMEREEETAQTFKEILRIVSNEYNNGNIPHTNSTPLNSEKELIYMKATGIVRRIDDLGRVVIPKEIRRTLRIREGDPLEIFTASDGEVIFKKYSPMGELSEFSGQYSDILSRTADLPVIITDRDHVISVSGLSKKDYMDRHISKELEEIMENRDKYIKTRDNDRLYPIDNCDIEALTAFPIIAAGDIGGAVIFLSNGNYSKLTDTEVKLAQVAATFLGKQMEE